MNGQIGLIVKVFILSVSLSILIKYGGGFLPIEPNLTNAIIGITVPPFLMFLALLWRNQHPSN
jgi:hypothetical protein